MWGCDDVYVVCSCCACLCTRYVCLYIYIYIRVCVCVSVRECVVVLSAPSPAPATQTPPAERRRLRDVKWYFGVTPLNQVRMSECWMERFPSPALSRCSKTSARYCMESLRNRWCGLEDTASLRKIMVHSFGSRKPDLLSLLQQYQTSKPSFVIVTTALGTSWKHVWWALASILCASSAKVVSFHLVPLTKGNNWKKHVVSKYVFPLQMTGPLQTNFN